MSLCFVGVCSSLSSSYCSSLVDEAHVKHVGTSLVVSTSSLSSVVTSSLEGVLKDLPLHIRYEWVDNGVCEYFSKYKWSSSVCRFINAHLVLGKESPDDVVSVDKVGRVDNACHG